jgi:hypothetical protein
LAPDKKYLVNTSSALRRGASLRNVGLDVELEGDGDSLLIRLDAVTDPED